MTRIFGVDYQFLSCGDVFTQGLARGARRLGVDYAHADWNAPDLPQQVKAFAPDLLVVVHGRKFAKRWKLAQFPPAAVWLLDEPYEVDETSTWAHAFAHVFVNDPATIHRHPGATYLPVCYDPSIYFQAPEPRRHALGFIGGGNPTRERYLSALAHRGLVSYIIGGPWDGAMVQRLCQARNIPAFQTAALYQQTRIVLNVFRERHHYNRQQIPATAMNPRIYEATACGALVVSETRAEIASVVPDLPTFRTEAECVDIVAALMAHPDDAEAIRQRCMERIAPHTYAARLQTMLQTCGLAVAA